MINLNIGKAVVSIIRNANCGVSVFAPCVAEANTTLPYAVYTRNSVMSDDTKDIQAGIHKANITISIFSDDYDNSLTIAQKVVNAIDGYRGSIQGCYIYSCNVTDVAEEWTNDAYRQTLEIEFRYK